MRLLYPEETNLPVARIISVWLYRFTLFVVPRVLLIATPLLAILRITGVVAISWWWILTPCFLALAPLLLMCIIVACGTRIAARHEKMQCTPSNSANRTNVGIYRHNATGQYYVIGRSSEGEILGGFRPNVPEHVIEDLCIDPEAYEEFKTHLANFCSRYPEWHTPDDLMERFTTEEFTLCDPTRSSQESPKKQQTPEDERLADVAKRCDQQSRPHFGCFDSIGRP